MTRTVLARQLKAGDTIYVSGKMVYSHITRKIEMGTPKFEKANQRKIAQGAEPATASYTSLTISHPSIKTKNADAFKYVSGDIVADTSKMTPLEVYMYETMYKNKTTGEWRLSNENKGNLPSVGEINTTTNEITLITPKGELAVGLDVVLVFQVFQTKTGRQGVGLQAVLSRGEIKYYSSADATSALQGLGFAIKDQRDAELAETEVEPAQVNQPAQETIDFDTAATAANPDPIGAEDGGDELPWS